MFEFWILSIRRTPGRQSELLEKREDLGMSVLAQLVISAVLTSGLIQPLAAEERSNRAEWHGRQEAGVTAYRRGDYHQAEADLKRACEIAESFQQPDARLILSLNKLAAVHSQQARYDEAELLLQTNVSLSFS